MARGTQETSTSGMTVRRNQVDSPASNNEETDRRHETGAQRWDNRQHRTRSLRGKHMGCVLAAQRTVGKVSPWRRTRGSLRSSSCLRRKPPRTATLQDPLSLGFSRRECWSRLPLPPPGALPDPGIEPMSAALAGRFFTAGPPGKRDHVTPGFPR